MKTCLVIKAPYPDAPRTAPRGSLRIAPILALSGMMVLGGCDTLLDVENPNQLVQADVESPAAANALANGALSTVARGYGEAMLLHAVASDELQFAGSRDAWIQLQEGDLRDPANEFSDAAWPFVSEGRWMADEAVRILEGFDAEGVLPNRTSLARARLYSAIAYTQIADLWEEFVFSDRMEDGPPIRGEGILGLYDQSLRNLDQALPIAQGAGNVDLQATILAQRARTRHARGVRGKVLPAGSSPADPLVNDASAVADARAALALVGPDWEFRFNFSAATVSNNWGAWVNERLELRPSDAYVIPTSDGKRVAQVTLPDPIDNIPVPSLVSRITTAVGARQFGPLPVVTAVELRLIIAEAALSAGDMGTFTEEINRIRTQDGLSPYTGQMDALELLKNARMAHLYLLGRRLNDHYRFGTQSFLWNEFADAARQPGATFPIAQIERTANCFLLGTC